MLDLKNIRKTFNPNTVNEKIALNGIDLHLDDGDFVTIIGGNGAGKSTMLNAIAGVWPVDSGSIVSSAGEPHAYYANSYNGQTSTYFRFSPSWENGTGYNQIYWDNAGYLFVWME